MVIFGGGGFIGTHLCAYLLERNLANSVVIADIKCRPSAVPADDRRRYVHVDVRHPIELRKEIAPDLIVNLAAVHREPGHEPHEYYDTNVRGAEHVCQYATTTQCSTVVFTSSISVYGPSEDEKDERSLPVPVTPYGASKLIAEQVHWRWEASLPENRLLIVRPGVVFGPGEGGNVTRLVRAVARGYYVFVDNHHVKKAGGYVRELCRTIVWGLDTMGQRGLSSLLFNFTQTPPPELHEFVAAVADVLEVERPRLSVPVAPVLAASHVAHWASRVLRLQQPLHPVRVRKLTRSNNIVSGVLREYGYVPQYSLKSSLQDWKSRMPSEW